MANHLSYDLLSRVVERRSTSVEEAKAQRHLAACGRCRSELAWLERIRNVPRHSSLLDTSQGSDVIGDHWVREASAFWLRGGPSTLLR
jgi:hypothetical protein